MLDVVEAFLRIDHHETAVDFEAFDEYLLAVFFREARDAVHDGKNRVGHGNLFQSVFGKTDFDFLAEGFVPFVIGATGAREKEAALHEIFSELLAFFRREGKGFVAGHDAEREIEERVGIEADRAEGGVDAEVGLLRYVREKIVSETNGAFVAGVNEIAALEEREIGVDRRGRG